MAQPRWRLVNGTTPAEGRLEYQLNNGDWVCVGTKVNKNYHPNRFNDLCRLLGFQRVMTYYRFSSSSLFGRCFGRIYDLMYSHNEKSAATMFIEYPDGDQAATSTGIGLRCINGKLYILTKSDMI